MTRLSGSRPFKSLVRPLAQNTRLGLAVISQQNVDLFGAWLPAEDSAASLVVAKPDALKEADPSKIATVRGAKHLLHACEAKRTCRASRTAAVAMPRPWRTAQE